MKDEQEKWLPHLVNAIPQQGFGKSLSMVTIALEGWRRGLDLKFFRLENKENKMKIRFILSDKNREHYFESSRGDLTTDEAFEICDNKYLTKRYLEKAGVPTAGGKRFTNESSYDEIVEYAKQLGFPLVIKPTDANGGKGVFANITNPEAFRKAVYEVMTELKYNEIIVEKYIEGEEYRVVVIEDRVVGVLNRIPANVVGDGQQSIKELIKEKNKKRTIHPHLKSRKIKVDETVKDFLSENNYKLSTIPKEGELIPLRVTSNLSTGGDSVELTDQFDEKYKQIAIEGTKAIPGLAISGMDMIINKEKEEAVIIEANTRPGLGGHLFPVHGEPRDIPKDIIDYYFPETKNISKTTLYFDYNEVVSSLKNRQTKEVKVSNAPLGKLFSKKYIVSGKVQVVGYRMWIKKEALKRNLHGYVENLDDGTVCVVIAGTSEDTVNNFKFVCYEGPSKASVDFVEEYSYNEPIKIGFEIVRPEKKLTHAEIRKMMKENERLTNENEKLTNNYQKLINRKSWRYTEPLRNTIKKLRKK